MEVSSYRARDSPCDERGPCPSSRQSYVWREPSKGRHARLRDRWWGSTQPPPWSQEIIGLEHRFLIDSIAEDLNQFLERSAGSERIGAHLHLLDPSSRKCAGHEVLLLLYGSFGRTTLLEESLVAIALGLPNLGLLPRQASLSGSRGTFVGPWASGLPE
jgi:hypothetical protein